MSLRAIVLTIATLALGSYVIFLLFFQNTAPAIAPTAPLPEPVAEPNQELVVMSDSIRSRTEGSYSVGEFKVNPDTEKITDQGLYSHTLDEQYYEIMFFEPAGTLTILLYREPLSFARGLAEKQLKEVLPYTEEEICDMDIKVRVNRAVSDKYHAVDLGLSFCPFSNPLEE